MPKKYYLFGLQRSGTNFLRFMLHKNLDVKNLNRNAIYHRVNWKHSVNIPREYRPGFPTLVIYKNPYLWIESLCLRNNGRWNQTQNKYPATKPNKNPDLNLKGMNVENLIKTYRDFHVNWFGVQPTTVMYEKLIDDNYKKYFLEKISDKYDFNRMHRNWVYPSYGEIGQSNDYNRERELYYIRGIPEELTRAHIDIINSTIGEDMFDKLGYKML